MSLAATARVKLQQAEKTEKKGAPSDAPICRQHSCRVSRCGCVTEKPASRGPDKAASRARAARLAALEINVAENSKRSKGKSATIPGVTCAHEWPSQSSPKHDGQQSSIPHHRRSAPTLPTLTDIGECVEELYLESASEAPITLSVPGSPSPLEFTDSVLRKSQRLLQQLSDLNLDIRDEDSKCDAKETDSPSGQSQVSLCLSQAPVGTARYSEHSSKASSKEVNSLETVEVPVMFLKMLTEKYEMRSALDCLRTEQYEMRSALECMRSVESGHSSSVCESLLSMSTASACDGPFKERSCNLSSSRSSLFSAASTRSPRKGSDGAFSSNDSSTGSPCAATLESSVGSGQLHQRRPAPIASSRYAAPFRTVPARAMSPQRATLGYPCHRAAPATAQRQPLRRSASQACIQRQSSLQHLSLCRQQPVPAAAAAAGAAGPSQTVTITASAPPGSSVSVMVTAPPGNQRAQSLCIVSC